MSRRRALFALALAVAFAAALPARAQQLFTYRADPVPEQVEAMYQKGLDWLVRNQTAQGGWNDSYGQQPAVIGLAVLAMLAHGDDPNFGPYAAPLRKALDAILNARNPGNGYLGTSMYNHGFATLALAEAYGAVDDPRLGPALEKSVDFLISCQKRNPMGAWRYSPESQDADTTVSGACIVALLAARNAGIGVSEEAVNKALLFYKQCQSGDGGFGYTGPSGSGAARTAIGGLAYALAKKKDTVVFKGAMRFLKQGADSEGNYYQHYYLYYAAQTYFHAGMEEWDPWNAGNMKALQSSQASDGSWTGSHGTSFGTVASLLSLALNFRYLPIYER